MSFEIKIDLDEIFSGDNWGTTVGEMVREEVRSVVRSEIKKAVKSDADLKKAIKALQKRAAQNIVSQIG